MNVFLRRYTKYVEVFRIQISSHLVYVVDFLMRTLFLVLILFIFTQLWETTFSVSGEQKIAGYSLSMMMWYLVVTEAIMMAMPRLVEKVENEVKNGDIVYFLQRPLSYVGYHCSSFMAESFFRITLNLIVGGLLIFLLYGVIEISWTNGLATVLLIIGAFTLHFLLTMTISLFAFWVEEARGYELVFTKMVMILGGMMVPLDIFPNWLESIARALPFQYIVYIPASYAVGMAVKPLHLLLLEQWVWIISFIVITSAVFYLGVKKLNVNGG